MGQKLVFITNAEASKNVSILSFSYFLPIGYRERGKERVSECVLSGLDTWPFHSEWMGRRVEDLNKQTA